ncbi:hypothetical protein N665_1787s0006 [Sinapis alba]|nr:hypothetical protein N665_1787s0006 [Sinapis alba]
MLLLFLLMLFFPKNVVCQGSYPTGGEFSFNGLLYAARSANLNSNGLFRLTNSKKLTSGQVFYNFPLRFKALSCGLSMTENRNSLMSHFILFVFLNQSFHSFLYKKIFLPICLNLCMLASFSSTGMLTASHYILAWNFKMNGTTQDIDPSRLPEVPRFKQPWILTPKGVLTINLTTSGVTLLILLSLGLWLLLKRKKLLEVLEDWELQFGPHRRKGELNLVYDCMPKGSVDKFLYQQKNQSLNWSQRLKIIKDVASGLCYLHQQWVQVTIHRDIKPANILLDGTMNAKLGDFGLAKLCDHGIDPQTSHLGYISPELSRTGKASTSSDVFALGVVMLEITCGRKPILSRASQREMLLTDWVLECWENGDIMQVLDQKIEQDYSKEQVELVLKLGLLCSHPVAAIRPNMSSVIQYLDSVAQLPHNLLEIAKSRQVQGDTEISGEAAVSLESCSVAPLTFTEAFVSHGR